MWPRGAEKQSVFCLRIHVHIQGILRILTTSATTQGTRACARPPLDVVQHLVSGPPGGDVLVLQAGGGAGGGGRQGAALECQASKQAGRYAMQPPGAVPELTSHNHPPPQPLPHLLPTSPARPSPAQPSHRPRPPAPGRSAAAGRPPPRPQRASCSWSWAARLRGTCTPHACSTRGAAEDCMVGQGKRAGWLV